MDRERNEIEQPTCEEIVETVRQFGLKMAAERLCMTRRQLAMVVARRGIDLVGELAPPSYVRR